MVSVVLISSDVEWCTISNLCNVHFELSCGSVDTRNSWC